MPSEILKLSQPTAVGPKTKKHHTDLTRPGGNPNTSFKTEQVKSSICEKKLRH